MSQARIQALRARLAELELDALLVSQIHNVRWLSGFTGSTAVVIVTSDRAILATDSRYTTQATAQCPDLDVVQLGSSAPDETVKMITGLAARRIGFEAATVSFHLYQQYHSAVGEAVALVPTDGLVERLRLCKDAAEVACIRRAVDVVDRAFECIVPHIGPGVTERQVMLRLERFMREDCSAEIAFDTIVASGPRSALPHGKASGRTIEAGDFVTMDYGAVVDGYCSDITRTVVVGPATDRQAEVYSTVKRAMELAIEAIHPGAEGRAIDAIARDHIAAAGFGAYFGHGLGHSIGLVVHDGPGFSPRSELVLAPGMTLTVEPGIYLPDWGGVRIEQDVLITETGAEVLTQGPTHLIELKQ